jgi:hypothetical protein
MSMRLQEHHPRSDARRKGSTRRQGQRLSGARLVDRRLLDSIRFTDHCLEQFAKRAGLPTTKRPELESVIEDLLECEGLRVSRRPKWARSLNSAPLYLQAGEWMLFIGRYDRRLGPGYYSIVTVVNGPEHNTWEHALSRRYIFTPPPLQITPPTSARIGLLQSITQTIAERPAEMGLVAGIRRTHRVRSERAHAAYEKDLADYRDSERRYGRAREQAREQHLRRYGFR